MLAEGGGESVGDFVQRNAAGIGRNDGVRLAERFDLVPQATLDFQIFGDGFDDPVAGGYLGKVVFKIAGGDEGSGVVCKKSTGPQFGGVVNSLERGGVAIGLVGKNNIEQNGWNAGVGEVGGDPGAHGAGSEDGNFLNGSHLN